MSSATVPPSSLVAIGSDFRLPRTLQYNLGVQRRLLRRAVLDVGYLGSRGDFLLQPVDVNAPLPADVVAANGAVNLARPYQGYASITTRQTTARSRYDALAVSLRYEAGRTGTLAIAYTLSRAMTGATNDRDTVDLPQDRTNLDAEYALARTDRTHVFTANGVLDLPFYRDGQGPAKALLGGWRLSGILTFWSGPPVSRVVTGNTNGGRRGSRLDAVGEPFTGVPESGPGYVYWFAPAAFAPPADGALGNTGRAPFRLPGVNQWDLTLAKTWGLPGGLGLQLRADFLNAFNHTQLDPAAIQNVCVATSGTCAVEGSSFGQITATRSPREIQLGLRLSWN